MSMDPRCKWLSEKNAKYYALLDRVIDKYLVRICREHGMTTVLCKGDYQFLAAVADAQTEDVSMAQIARKLGINPSSATRRNRRLLECGLVSKTSDAADERRYQIALTDAGRAFFDDMDRGLLEVIGRVYSTVSDEEMAHVYAFTEACIDNLQKILDE